MSICRDTSSNKIPCSSSNAVNQFSLADWDPILSMNQNPNFNGSAGFSSHNAGVPESPWMTGPNATAIEKFLNLSCIDSDNNSEIMGSFGSCDINQIASDFCPSEAVLPEECGIVKNLKKKKRKRMPECSDVSPHSSVIGVQNEQEEDGSPKALGSPMIVDEKNKNVEAIKEDYIHVRAKSGQATNSHSLAERVRRERINDRMKLLQGLVPGCNKITGKASMLDEIINYVQSLQKQVEFLSMKLVAVDSGLTLSTRQVALKDNQISEYGVSAIQRYNPISLYGSSQQQVIQAELAISSSHNLGDMQRSRITSHLSSMAQLSSTLHHELQDNIQMDFILLRTRSAEMSSHSIH